MLRYLCLACGEKFKTESLYELITKLDVHSHNCSVITSPIFQYDVDYTDHLTKVSTLGLREIPNITYTRSCVVCKDVRHTREDPSALVKLLSIHYESEHKVNDLITQFDWSKNCYMAITSSGRLYCNKELSVIASILATDAPVNASEEPETAEKSGLKISIVNRNNALLVSTDLLDKINLIGQLKNILINVEAGRYDVELGDSL